MIKTMIVEDEFYIRKGLIHSLPWESFGMEIIGEADNGESALEFLQQNEADLVITDLTMPVMSGLDLMRALKAARPELHIAVLTCHRDFDYIQEALRLGAIDYMVKTKMESSELEEALGRISAKIIQFMRKQETAASGWIWIDRSGVTSAAFEEFKAEHALIPHPMHAYIGYMPATVNGKDARLDASLASKTSAAGLSLLVVKDLDASDWINHSVPIMDYIQGPFFYAYDTALQPLTITLQELLSRSGSSNNNNNNKQTAGLHKIKESWQSCGWLFNQSKWEEWLQLVRAEQPSPKQLTDIIEATYEEWMLSSTLQLKDTRKNGIKGFFFCWEDIRVWLSEVRIHLQQQATKHPYSTDILTSIFRSLPIISEQLSNGLNQSDVAQKVNMSRGYFSLVFKETMGMSFNDYAKEYSLWIAKRYLSRNEYPIYWIAEQAGFKDERYFSRLFKQQTGLLPSEYRIQHKDK